MIEREMFMDYYFISYGLTFSAMIIVLVAQAFVSGCYSKYSKVRNIKGISGSEVARNILDNNGLSDIYVVEVRGLLTDHYDPKNKVVRLSSNIYRGDSIASVAVACHECGHAIQDKDGYLFMRIRSSLVPIVNISSYAGYFAIMFGILASSFNLIWTGIILEMIILLFQVITLPVEFNASKRALIELEKYNFLNSDELEQGKVMLISAAFTYVASVASTLLQILRLILLFGRRDD